MENATSSSPYNAEDLSKIRASFQSTARELLIRQLVRGVIFHFRRERLRPCQEAGLRTRTASLV